MTLEEKRILRIEISQMLADAGINRTTLREMVEEAIDKKVDRAIEQSIKKLDSEAPYPHNFIVTKIEKAINEFILGAREEFEIKNAAKKILSEKVARALRDYSVIITKNKEE